MADFLVPAGMLPTFEPISREGVTATLPEPSRPAATEKRPAGHADVAALYREYAAKFDEASAAGKSNSSAAFLRGEFGAILAQGKKFIGPGELHAILDRMERRFNH